MRNSGYELRVRNCRAVDYANIRLDEVTVLAGVNASGKSTLAHILHAIINLNAIYPTLARRQVWNEIAKIVQVVYDLWGRVSENSSPTSDEMFPDFATCEREALERVSDFNALILKISAFAALAIAICADKIEGGGDADASRAYDAFLRSLNGLVADAENTDEVQKRILNRLNAARDDYAKYLKKRDYRVLSHSDEEISKWLRYFGSITLIEGDAPVYSTKAEAGDAAISLMAPLKEIYGIKQAFYIESPWVSLPQIDEHNRVTLESDRFRHPQKPNAQVLEGNLFEFLCGEFELQDTINGIQVKGLQRMWEFKRKDGLSFALNDCATGVKAMAILNVLYTRGYLNEETLLIIDEPEAHLHPQWVFEYARVLMLIAKKLKVRMLLTSHSPDMISAIQKVAKVEKLEGVNFYVAEETEKGSFLYNYKPLGDSIEEIFDKFNVAIDKTDVYPDVV